MFVGVLRLSFSIVGASSLKDKRRVVRSFKERVVNKYRVSVAEVGELDNHRFAWIGVAVVANEAAHCDSVLSDVAATASNLPDAILNDRATEIIPFGHGGAQIAGGIEKHFDLSSGGHDDDD
ncbi:MAG: DUF503 domain-containing protein [Polyangiaceae bacterium]|nr:DUF503 domain-containing protein [Polyangiaceae bacterium]